MIVTTVMVLSWPEENNLSLIALPRNSITLKGSERLGIASRGTCVLLCLGGGGINSWAGTDPSVILAWENLALGAIPIRPLESSNTVTKLLKNGSPKVQVSSLLN